MAKTAILLVCCALWSAQARFLAPPANAAASNTSASDDDDIAALSAQIAETEGQVETFKKTANITDDQDPMKEDFHHHCKAEDKATLDKAGPNDEVFPRKDEDSSKADSGVLGVFAESMKATERKSLIENEEFLLGLLMMHHTRADWSREQELDAICSMARESPLAEKLYKNHTSKQPLAMQFALLMDVERKTMKPTKAPPLSLDGGVNSLGMKEGGAGASPMGIIAKLMSSVGGGKKQQKK